MLARASVGWCVLPFIQFVSKHGGGPFHKRSGGASDFVGASEEQWFARHEAARRRHVRFVAENDVHGLLLDARESLELRLLERKVIGEAQDCGDHARDVIATILFVCVNVRKLVPQATKHLVDG